MKKILDIEFAPLATYQSLIGDLFSVISLHSNFKEWLCSNINQLVYFRDFEEREFYGMGFFYEHQPREYQNMYFDIPLIETNKIDISCIDKSLIEFIKSKINNNYYLRIPINMKEIKCVKKALIHMVFVYGYDEEKKEIYVSNFHNGGKYNRYRYSFLEMEEGFHNRMKNVENYLNDIIYFKNINFNYPLLVEKFRSELVSFLNGTDLYNKYKYSIRWGKCQIFFGIYYIEELIWDIESGKGDLRALYVLYDFLRIINAKREVFFEYGYFQNKENERLKINMLETIRKMRIAIIKWIYYKERFGSIEFRDNKEMKEYMVHTLREIKQKVVNIISLLLGIL